LVAFAATYAAVPLYKIYCQTTGKGGQAVQEKASEKIAAMMPNKDRVITITMEADTGSTMAWNFRPLQREMKVIPGETALAFYSAKNPLKRPVTGIATYTVLPFEAGVHLNKIQCFCFEEQRLNPDEEVELPVFFYIDPEYANDPLLENINDIVLHYTFHESKEALQLPFIEKLKDLHVKTMVSNK
jgi:cytochrome c oxidase assembly protein subunit 11